jgi:hypothetical protein
MKFGAFDLDIANQRKLPQRLVNTLEYNGTWYATDLSFLAEKWWCQA